MLGEGGFGVVLEAEHLGHGGRVAIKLLRPELAVQAPIVARFLREARALASMRGEHVARILDVASGPGEPFIVMEYLKGNDLGKLVAARGALPVASAVDHVLQACTAIAEAHALGIVHRDIKPSNLFLTTRPDGSACIKVLDFGIAKAITPNANGAASITRTQDVVGTPLYMAPEQMRSAKIVDPRTDVWALGATLYELLAGKPAFGGATISEIYAMVLTDAPAPLASEIPAPIVAAVLRCLEKKPEHRFPDVASFAAAIAPYASSRVAPLATSPSLGPVAMPVVMPETISAQHYTLPLGTIATAGRRARTPVLAALAAIAALGVFVAIPRVEAAPATMARRTPVVEAPRVMAHAELTLAPAAPKPVTKPRKSLEPTKSSQTEEANVPPPAPRGVATSRFE
jgi:serine/threonine-protein kinase